MTRAGAFVLACVFGWCASVAPAQQNQEPAKTPDQAPGQAPGQTPEKSETPGKSEPARKVKEPGKRPPAADPNQKATFPPFPTKNLYAKNDLRGKEAPALYVKKWLTAEPKTKDKVVLIDFWATWCGPCKKLIPELNTWQKKFEGDLVVIGISDEPEAKVRDFMNKTVMLYSVGVDPTSVMNLKVGVKGIPNVLVISSDGVVRWQGFPQNPEEVLTEAMVKRIIDADKARREAEKPAATKPKDEPKKKDAKEPAKKGG